MCLPCWHCPLPGPSPLISSMFVGDGKCSSPPHIHPCPKFPFPSPPPGGKRRGGGGGAGLPLGTAVAQSISPKPRIFLLPKRKKRKKKSQRPPFLPAPSGQSRLDLWGSREGGSGLELSGKSGGAPRQALRQAHFGRPLSPSPGATHQRWPSLPAWAAAWAQGGSWPALHCILCPPSPELGIFFHELLWGHRSPPQVCAIFSPFGGRRG